KFTDNSTQDLTNVVAWASSDSTIATMSNAFGSQGMACALKVGTINIQASVNGVTGNTGLQVTAPIPTRIRIAPVSAAISTGQTLQFGGTVTLSDGSIQPLTAATWTSSIPSIASIGVGSGIATGMQVGTTQIGVHLSGLDSHS